RLKVACAQRGYGHHSSLERVAFPTAQTGASSSRGALPPRWTLSRFKPGIFCPDAVPCPANLGGGEVARLSGTSPGAYGCFHPGYAPVLRAIVQTVPHPAEKRVEMVGAAQRKTELRQSVFCSLACSTESLACASASSAAAFASS